ncbi:sulfite exporter TauE/SafE family protein [Affinibrenneria salicis]|uniref:Probable membrane transporter protein n=1 Tax=Affinibrenneria salicis TaxID=2590031 RepID=A0A5J5G0Y7_9GAMM|nr:sulfite exporter TauE/SafE family protein [Affinibrenneria salicis]KAA8999387.1 sulfite exporter TauE/SafE family protein [Affinibrenneria salicis]
MVALCMIAACAGLVRGYCGFGFALIAVLGFSILMPPHQALSCALLLDLLSALPLLRSGWRTASRPLLRRLLYGMCAALLPGLWLVYWLPSDMLRLLIALMTLCGGVLIVANIRLRALSLRHAPLAGVVSGLAMTTASAGGPPLMLYLLNLPLRSAPRRATAIVFFIVSSLLACAGLLFAGALTTPAIVSALMLLLPSLAGNLAGHLLCLRHPGLPARWSVAPLLIVMALGAIAQSPLWLTVSHRL